jgi:hypothetical protein
VNLFQFGKNAKGAVGIATRYRLDGPGIETQRGRNFPQTCPGTLPKTNIKNPKNYKQIKYQPTNEEKSVKDKTTNKFQPELAQVDTPNPKLKIK